MVKRVDDVGQERMVQRLEGGVVLMELLLLTREPVKLLRYVFRLDLI